MVTENTYEEVYEILQCMDKLTVMKISDDVLNTIVNKRNKSFKTKIDKNDIFNVNNMSSEALDYMCALDYNFWMDEKIKNDYKKNANKEILDKYKNVNYYSNNIFRNKDEVIKNDVSVDESSKKETVEIAIYKESIFKKLLNKIMSFFKINLNNSH